MFKMDLILENLTAQIYLTSYLLRGKWSTVATWQHAFHVSTNMATCPFAVPKLIVTYDGWASGLDKQGCPFQNTAFTQQSPIHALAYVFGYFK